MCLWIPVNLLKPCSECYLLMMHILLPFLFTMAGIMSPQSRSVSSDQLSFFDTVSILLVYFYSTPVLPPKPISYRPWSSSFCLPVVKVLLVSAASCRKPVADLNPWLLSLLLPHLCHLVSRCQETWIVLTWPWDKKQNQKWIHYLDVLLICIIQNRFYCLKEKLLLLEFTWEGKALCVWF